MKILDGAFGTLVGEYSLPDDAYVLDGQDAKGFIDVLCLTRPDVVADIHRRYAEAGADIITTNSLCANAFPSHRAYDISRRAAELAKSTGRFVAGWIGTTSDKLADTYRAQAQGLVDGGADALLLETITDLHDAWAAIAVIRTVSTDIPIMISATLDPSGHLYSGQTVEEFCSLMADAHPMSIGLNCGYGPVHLLPYLRRLSAVASCEVSFYPSAGLPDHYLTPEAFAAAIAPAITEELATIIGGCCGTTPSHIATLKAIICND